MQYHLILILLRLFLHSALLSILHFNLAGHTVGSFEASVLPDMNVGHATLSVLAQHHPPLAFLERAGAMRQKHLLRTQSSNAVNQRFLQGGGFSLSHSSPGGFISTSELASPGKNVSVPTYDADATFLDYYEEWLRFLITAIRGDDSWISEEPETRVYTPCSQNHQLKNRVRNSVPSQLFFFNSAFIRRNSICN